VGLIARALEEQGIATVCVVMNRDIVENVKPPRALFVRFPYGAPLGPAGDGVTQMAVIRAALDLLVSATRPGTIVVSDIEWPE
jgi:D-proline reductase (dithiol) PrdB